MVSPRADDLISVYVLLLSFSVSLNIQNIDEVFLVQFLSNFHRRGLLAVLLVEKVKFQRCLPEPAAVVVLDAEMHKHRKQECTEIP